MNTIKYAVLEHHMNINGNRVSKILAVREDDFIIFNATQIDPENMDVIDDVINNEVMTNEKIIDKLMEIEARARIEADAVMLEARRKQYELLMNRMTSCNCYNMRVMCDIIDKEN